MTGVGNITVSGVQEFLLFIVARAVMVSGFWSQDNRSCSPPYHDAQDGHSERPRLAPLKKSSTPRHVEELFDPALQLVGLLSAV